MVLQGWVTPQETEGFVSQIRLQVSWLEERVTDSWVLSNGPVQAKATNCVLPQRLADDCDLSAR